jgi:hypothetical protein
MAYIAYADGKRKDIPASEVTITKAQEIVGGYVELVAPRESPELIFLCDEDGHSKKKPINAHGCELYGSNSIVGDIIVLTRKEAKSHWLS